MIEGWPEKIMAAKKLYRLCSEEEPFLVSAMAASTTREQTNTLVLIARFSRTSFTCRDAMVKSVPFAGASYLVVIAPSMKAKKMLD